MMASVPPPFASMECGSLRKHECSGLSCAWKAPRAMTGSLASTARGHYAAQDGWRRQRCGTALRGTSSTRLEVLRTACFNSPQGVYPFISRNHGKSPVRSVFGRYWKLHCKSSDSESSDALSPESLWEDLEPVISYLPPEELDLVYHALKLAYKAHHGQKRRSGQPFIIHPVEVARILGELELDWESIAAGLLHDTVEDTTLVTFERIEREFGATVRNIVEGETKVSKLGKLKCKDSGSSKQDVKADDLRQMFLAMTEEVRVIIVKLADRLHNMRTLAHMPQGKQSSIAMETLQVFAPLAKLLGMYQIKSELESLSFMYSNAKDFANIKQKADEFYMKHKKELAEAKNSLKQKIDDDRLLQLMPLKAEVRSVCKEPYSVYKKLKGSINDMNLVAQISIIVQSKNCTGLGSLYNAEQLCYHILGLVHGIWTPIPSTVKDFIATPKPNGYQSLHTTVIPFLYESMLRVEVQIRTEEMDLIARRGIAAHYSGKVASNLGRQSMNSKRSSRTKSICLNNADIALRIGWLNAIREWQEEFVGNMSSREFVDTIMRDLLGSRVFVFTPKGEIKNLPKGATTIDYAYLIHTEIGNKMVAAKVNGNMVPPEHVLENAEVVEIITYNSLSNISAFQKHERWLKHAKTRSARHKIMKFLREQATISATELTADAVNNFISDMEEDNVYETPPDCSKGIPKWKKLREIAELTSKISSENPLPENNFLGFPKINGKSNRSMQPVSINLNSQQTAGGYGFPPFFLATSADKEVLLGLESWKDSKVALWHIAEGHPIQWFCVVCIDQRGIMMTEVTSALTAASITICSCVAEMDRKKGLGVMLFHIEATLENLASACSGIDLILGVLGWSAGCSWCHPSAGQNYPEC